MVNEVNQSKNIITGKGNFLPQARTLDVLYHWLAFGKEDGKYGAPT